MKNETCPICRRKLRAPNVWVRFHVRYGARPIVILACKYCNWIEMMLRTKATDASQKLFVRSPYQPNRPTRAEMVVAYMKKYGIDLSPS